jgi:polyisoprenyl-teichoic acid--peptidoglycan teichoic acid transferase
MATSPNNFRSSYPRRDFTFEKKKYSGGRTKVHWGRFLIVILLFICLLGAMLGIFVSSLIGKFSVLEIFLSLVPSEALIGKTNILLVGIDATDGVRRSDMMMVVHVDPERGVVGALSIPRDSLVLIPGRGMDKINHAYAFGGMDLSIQTVSTFLKVPIDFYVKVEVDSLVKMIDQLGGVTVNVDQRMYYSDYAGNLFVDLQPGKQKLNGREAMGFVRFRHDSQGDFGRIGRQQSFIQALGNELSAPQNMSKLFWLLREFTSTVETSYHRVRSWDWLQNCGVPMIWEPW